MNKHMNYVYFNKLTNIKEGRTKEISNFRFEKGVRVYRKMVKQQ